MIRMRVSAARAVLVTSVAVATLGGLVAAPALASGGPAAGKPVAARSHNPIPYGMSAATYRRMRAQIPLDNAAERVRAAAAASPAARHGFVQVGVNADRGTLTVYWHGQVPAGVGRVFAALRSHVHLVVRPARYTLAQLNRAVRKVIRNPLVTSAGPLADGAGITVGTTSRVRATSPRSAQRLLHSAVPVSLHHARPAWLLACQPNTSDTLAAPARCNDLSPGFWGGAVISIFANGFINGFCSTGFGVHFSNGSTGMLTAGHCLAGPEVPSGASWWNGQATTELGGTAHTPYIGSSTVASHDSGVIVTPGTSANRYYDGPSIFSGDTHNTKQVVGAQNTSKGDWTCESGSFGGVLCNVHVQNTGVTQKFNNGAFVISGLAVASGGNASQPQGGDSGGPVFSLASAPGTVTAKGTVTGGDGVSVWYTPWQTITADLGVSINT